MEGDASNSPSLSRNAAVYQAAQGAHIYDLGQEAAPLHTPAPQDRTEAMTCWPMGKANQPISGRVARSINPCDAPK